MGSDDDMTTASSEALVPSEEPGAPAPKGDRLGDIARPMAITVRPTVTLRDAAEQMTANEVGLVVVLGDGRLLGVASERDIVMAIAEGADVDDDRVENVMALDVLSAATTTPAAEAAGMMLDAGIRHLPVVDGDRVVGVVSMRDLLPFIGR
jgi:CBS domain-containing protein